MKTILDVIKDVELFVRISQHRARQKNIIYRMALSALNHMPGSHHEGCAVLIYKDIETDCDCGHDELEELIAEYIKEINNY